MINNVETTLAYQGLNSEEQHLALRCSRGLPADIRPTPTIREGCVITHDLTTLALLYSDPQTTARRTGQDLLS